jgi:hypothetical protein
VAVVGVLGKAILQPVQDFSETVFGIRESEITPLPRSAERCDAVTAVWLSGFVPAHMIQKRKLWRQHELLSRSHALLTQPSSGRDSCW